MKIIKKVKKNNERPVGEMVHDIERIITYFVNDSYLKKWEHEVVLRKIIINLIRLFNNKTISLQNSFMQSALNLYTLKTVTEQVLADFAIIIDIAFHDGHEAEGVIFFKTLLRDQEKNTFSQLKKDKLKKLNTVSPHAALMLFDYDVISGMALQPLYNLSHDGENGFTESAYASNCVIVPANLALTLGHKNSGLYKISVPFSYELLNRYVYGLGLDYNAAALDIAKGFKTDKGYVKNLLHIAIGQAGAQMKSDVNYNWEVYTRYEQPGSGV